VILPVVRRFPIISLSFFEPKRGEEVPNNFFEPKRGFEIMQEFTLHD
jgi:hypothetical protein